MKATPEVAQALLQLRVNTDFAVVSRWLSEQLTKERDTCTRADGVALFRAQGAASVLQAFLDTVKDAPQILKSFSNPRQRNTP